MKRSLYNPLAGERRQPSQDGGGSVGRDEARRAAGTSPVVSGRVDELGGIGRMERCHLRLHIVVAAGLRQGDRRATSLRSAPVFTVSASMVTVITRRSRAAARLFPVVRMGPVACNIDCRMPAAGAPPFQPSLPGSPLLRSRQVEPCQADGVLRSAVTREQLGSAGPHVPAAERDAEAPAACQESMMGSRIRHAASTNRPRSNSVWSPSIASRSRRS